jgi:transposase-like protein
LDGVSPSGPNGSYSVTCPHCKRPFEAELLEGRAERYSGFKCPHCKLFVPMQRGEELPKPQPT